MKLQRQNYSRECKDSHLYPYSRGRQRPQILPCPPFSFHWLLWRGTMVRLQIRIRRSKEWALVRMAALTHKILRLETTKKPTRYSDSIPSPCPNTCNSPRQCLPTPSPSRCNLRCKTASRAYSKSTFSATPSSMLKTSNKMKVLKHLGLQVILIKKMRLWTRLSHSHTTSSYQVSLISKNVYL